MDEERACPLCNGPLERDEWRESIDLVGVGTVHFACMQKPGAAEAIARLVSLNRTRQIVANYPGMRGAIFGQDEGLSTSYSADTVAAVIPVGMLGEWPIVVMQSGRVWSLVRTEDGSTDIRPESDDDPGSLDYVASREWASLPHLPGTVAAINQFPYSQELPEHSPAGDE